MENTKRKLIVVFLIMAFAVFNVHSFSVNNAKAETEAEKTQKEYDKAAKELKKEEAELAALNSQAYKNQAQISATTARINKIKADMASKEAELKNLNAQAELNKKLLGEYIRQIYYANQDNDPLVELALFNGNLSDMVSDSDSMLSIKEKINDALRIINNAKIETEEAKEELADQQADHKKALNSQQAQQNEINSDIKETQATIGELRKKLAELQADLAVLTGKSYNAKDIQEAVEFASKKTGVPKGVLYGFLKMETNLGANTGQCTYKQVKKDAIDLWYGTSSRWKDSRALLDKRMNLFYDLVDNLGYSKDKKVSCTPRSYRGQGGAMGVSQFMSDTWSGYSARISAQTGHGKPNPWDLTDGVMGLALKVKGAGGTSDSVSAIKKASINYLGAFNSNYYNGIVYWSKNYKTLFP